MSYAVGLLHSLQMFAYANFLIETTLCSGSQSLSSLQVLHSSQLYLWSGTSERVSFHHLDLVGATGATVGSLRFGFRLLKPIIMAITEYKKQIKSTKSPLACEVGHVESSFYFGFPQMSGYFRPSASDRYQKRKNEQVPFHICNTVLIRRIYFVILLTNMWPRYCGVEFEEKNAFICCWGNKLCTLVLFMFGRLMPPQKNFPMYEWLFIVVKISSKCRLNLTWLVVDKLFLALFIAFTPDGEIFHAEALNIS